MFTLEEVTGTIGAEVRGLDLSGNLDEATVEKLTAALVEHKVLFFHDQFGLTPERQIAFGRLFGPLDPMTFTVEGHPEIMELRDTGTGKAVGETWHTDSPFAAQPPMATILRAVNVPSNGRDTVWADMCAAYEGLSSKMQRFVEALTAHHDVLKMAAAGSGQMDMVDLRQRFPIAEHSVVRIHPISGRKALYVNQMYTSDIVGMRADESRHMLDFLFAQTRFPEYHARFRWRVGDVAMWDNRSTQHYIVRDRAYPRVMHRISVSGDRPFGTADADAQV